ncbi:restriction endonuclease subunit S [Stutzerimonas nitrititolerans]|uniref:restriction endonuclease subunit S n=1 Tax=Stutzerimonas nitrititolerans TaxID=2482751 RepID=UPI002897D086|nr:restriction endonuclease subunit S [Stutzerimonas nitrititolerans]
MTFPCYPNYKASGFTWLGDVPEHWQLKRLGHYFDERRERASDTEFEPLSVTKHGIVPRLDSAAKTQDGDNRKKVLAGDFVINSRSDRKGSSGLSPLDGSVSLICTVLIPTGLHGPYIHHLFRSELFQEEYYRWGKGIVADLWSTNFSDMKNIVLGVPSEEEQTQIARFLDHETARIDALIEEQQRLIELLKEKRQAVISHAVTKGLDPTVPMKDSGVEWLGEVPAHWDVARVKNVAKLESGHTPSKDFPEYWEGGDIPWVSLNDSKQLKVTDYIEETQFMITELGVSNSSARILPARAVVFTRDATIGLAAITTKPMCVSQHLIAWICNENLVLPEYLLLVFYAMEEELDRFTFGATIKTIGMPDIRKLVTPVPPLAEQAQVVADVNAKRELIDQLIKESNTALSLHLERRSALISAAVTGKIDVRGWQLPVRTPAPESAVAEAH